MTVLSHQIIPPAPPSNHIMLYFNQNPFALSMPTFVQEFICSNYSELFFHIHIVNVNPIEMFVSVSSMIRERLEKLWVPDKANGRSNSL